VPPAGHSVLRQPVLSDLHPTYGISADVAFKHKSILFSVFFVDLFAFHLPRGDVFC
jgi:hypothetical protein